LPLEGKHVYVKKKS